MTAEEEVEASVPTTTTPIESGEMPLKNKGS